MSFKHSLIFLFQDDNATENLSVMFKFLASKETDDTRPRTIRIKGRDVSFKKTCGGIADCSFEELCGRPLWTNDYLKMTQVFHTVFIRDIPLLTRKNRSEARRFITLIGNKQRASLAINKSLGSATKLKRQIWLSNHAFLFLFFRHIL